jgi:signal transduction histidine kinase
VVQAEKLASIGRLAAGVAHEINNPIGVILGCAKMLRAAGDLPEDARDNLKAIEEEAEQCRAVVQDLLNLSRDVPPASTVLDLRDVAGDVLAREEAAAQAGRATVTAAMPEAPLLVKADAGRLRQAVRNIVRNAIEAMPEGGTLRVALRRDESHTPGDAPQTAWAEAEFADSGCGIAPEALERIFEPFFSTKPQGTGLGLAIAYSVVRAYGGVIQVRSDPGQGASFTIRLPLAEAGAPETTTASIEQGTESAGC